MDGLIGILHLGYVDRDKRCNREKWKGFEKR